MYNRSTRDDGCLGGCLVTLFVIVFYGLYAACILGIVAGVFWLFRYFFM